MGSFYLDPPETETCHLITPQPWNFCCGTRPGLPSSPPGSRRALGRFGTSTAHRGREALTMPVVADGDHFTGHPFFLGGVDGPNTAFTGRKHVSKKNSVDVPPPSSRIILHFIICLFMCFSIIDE